MSRAARFEIVHSKTELSFVRSGLNKEGVGKRNRRFLVPEVRKS